MRHINNNTIPFQSVPLISISAKSVSTSSKVVRWPVGRENRNHRHISRKIASINKKLKVDPTKITTFLPKLVFGSGVWFVHCTLSMFLFLMLVNSVKKGQKKTCKL